MGVCETGKQRETDTAGWQASEGLCAQIMGWPSADSMTFSNYEQEQSEFLLKTQVCFPFSYFNGSKIHADYNRHPTI